MIQRETYLQVADNSGAKKIMCIGILGGTRRRYARIGDIIRATVKEAIPDSKIKKWRGGERRGSSVRQKNTAGRTAPISSLTRTRRRLSTPNTTTIDR